MKDCLYDAIVSEQVWANAVGNNPSLHVAFGVDAHYVKGMGVTILSLLQSNPDMNFIFHVFYTSIASGDFDKLSQLAAEHNTTVHLYHIDQGFFKEFPTFAQFTSAIYNRLVVVSKLKGIADKVLYLDADIVCLTDLSELLYLNMSNSIIAAVQDTELAVCRQTKKLDIVDNRYFNSGFMYIDINKWHENNISEVAMQLIVENYNKYTFPDQDALNVALQGQVSFLDRKWNHLCDLNKDEIPANTVFLHYAGRTKPWSEWCLYPVRQHFLKFYYASPWKNIEFDQPTHYKHMRSYAKVCLRNGEFLRSLYWYFRYVQARLKKEV